MLRGETKASSGHNYLTISLRKKRWPQVSWLNLASIKWSFFLSTPYLWLWENRNIRFFVLVGFPSFAFNKTISDFMLEYVIS